MTQLCGGLLLGFGGGGSLPGPSAPTLAVADNGDGTGATATISGSSNGSSNVVYTTPADGNLESATWTNSGNRTANGTVALALSPGLYWFFCESTLNAQDSISNRVYLAVTSGADAILDQILNAVLSRIQALSLDGVASASIVRRKVFTDTGFGVGNAAPELAYPAVIISEGPPETMSLAAGTNSRDDIGYPVQVGIIAPDGQNPASDEGPKLLYRERILKAFRNQRLPGVSSVWTCNGEPRDVVSWRDWQKTKYVSLVVLRFYSRETRGV